MFDAYYRPKDKRTANTDKSSSKVLPIGIKLPGGRRELLSLEAAERLHAQLAQAISQAKQD